MTEVVIPTWCPVCEFVMKGSHDNRAFAAAGCCSSCFIEFVEGREERWSSGWRPDGSRLSSYLERRRRRK